jgi:hypothetical protein
MSIQKQIDTLTKSNLALDNILDFTTQVRTSPKDPKLPWSWEGREHLFQLYKDDSKSVIVLKARQMEITEYAVNVLLYYALKYPGTYVYTAPREKQVRRFSHDRLMKAINSSRDGILREYIKGKPAKDAIHIGKSVIYLYTAWGQFEGMRGIPADMVILDEIQDMQADALPVAQEMLTASKMKYLRMIGTPYDVGSQFEGLWNQSDRKQWDIPTKVWTPTWQSDQIWLSGYHITQLMAPHIVSQDEIELKKLRYSTAKFTNEVLGDFYAGLSRPITIDILRPLIRRTAPPFSRNAWSYAGIDWGTGRSAFSWFTLLQPYYEGNNIWRFELVVAEKSNESDIRKQAEWASQLIERFSPRKIVVDIGYGVAQYQDLIARFGKQKIVACNYVSSVEHPFHIDNSAYGTALIKADRTTWIERLIDVVLKGRIFIYTGNDLALENDIIDDYTAVYADTRKSPSGRDTKIWTHDDDSTDDAFQATVYGLMAHHLEAGIGNVVPSVVSFG